MDHMPLILRADDFSTLNIQFHELGPSAAMHDLTVLRGS